MCKKIKATKDAGYVPKRLMVMSATLSSALLNKIEVLVKSFGLSVNHVNVRSSQKWSNRTL